jgi:hypothetical protein
MIVFNIKTSGLGRFNCMSVEKAVVLRSVVTEYPEMATASVQGIA